MKKKIHSPWLVHVLIAIDKFGNAITGGNHENTISARTGRFANQKPKTAAIWWWKTLEWVIDVTFYPLDGPRHCLRAWKKDESKNDYIGSNTVLVLLTILVTIPVCTLVILPVTQSVLAIRGPVENGQWGRQLWQRVVSGVVALVLLPVLDLPLVLATIHHIYGFLWSLLDNPFAVIAGFLHNYAEWWCSAWGLLLRT